MDDVSASNGHHPERRERVTSINPYADARAGNQPPEIVEFELNTDPYANMLPRLSTISTGADGDEDETPRRRSPMMVAISILLIAVLVLPVMVQVFAKLLH